MELHDLDMNLLVVFNQLLLDRRVSTAALSLGLTQPAVSNALKRLRSVLGDELFVRTYHGMQPTPYAEQLAEPVLQAMDTLRDALSRENKFDPSTSTRTFRLVMTDIGEINLIPRLMDELARLAPGCVISTVRENQMGLLNEDLQDGTVDLAIGLIPQLRAGFFQRRLMRQHYVCLCRKDHPATRELFSLQQFSAYGHVRVIAANTGHGDADVLMTRLGIKRSVRLEVPHFAAVGHILERTDLLATVPQRFASISQEHFALTALPHPVPFPEFSVNMLWHARYHRDPANRWLRQLIFDLFSES